MFFQALVFVVRFPKANIILGKSSSKLPFGSNTHHEVLREQFRRHHFVDPFRRFCGARMLKCCCVCFSFPARPPFTPHPPDSPPVPYSLFFVAFGRLTWDDEGAASAGHHRLASRARPAFALLVVHSQARARVEEVAAARLLYLCFARPRCCKRCSRTW